MGIRAKLEDAWNGPAASVVLSTLYPTVFVLSQNWYALHASQTAWLLMVALASGLAIYAVLEAGVRGGTWVGRRLGWSFLADGHRSRDVVFALACTGLLYLLLQATLKSALPGWGLRMSALAGLAIVLLVAFQRGAYRYVNTFLGALVLVAGISWVAATFDKSQDWISSVRQDFETAAFKRKPNIYLFIYDAYGSDDAYRKVFDFDNTGHYAALEQRGFKVLHTFSNYKSTLQTTIALFLGAHHYYSTETGFDDTQKGRPLLAGVIHNPVLSTLKRNSYRLQYIHSIDYFVNEQGILDYMFPDKPISSSLRVFGVPLLKMKRKISADDHKQALYSNIKQPAGATREPWFTFVHVNLPGHADLSANWRDLANFVPRYRQRTVEANAHMLETIDKIKATDPGAVIAIFGDHGAHRYAGLAEAADPNAAFVAAGVPAEKVALDDFGIMLAIASAGVCDKYLGTGTTPINIMRSLFACLAEDDALLVKRAGDITLFRNKKSALWLAARDGKPLLRWEPFKPD